jgi:class 3 adenylate cyclase
VAVVDSSVICKGLTASLCAVLLAGSLFVRAALEAHTGQRLDVLNALLALGLALAFQPLQRHMASMVDRWPRQRQLTLFFMDIVGSTELLVGMGDERWHGVLRDYRATTRRQLKRFGGHEVDTAGDGFFATFDSPERAVSCAHAIAAAMNPLGLRVRIGLHLGQCSTGAENISGLSVHAAARVMAMANPGEVLLSEALRAALEGTAITLAARGSHVLKGVPGEWPLYAAV